MESEYGCSISFLIIISEFFRLAFPNGQGIGLVWFDIRGRGLNIKENWFLGNAIVILCPDNEFSPVGNLGAVDDEGVVVADILFHELDALFELDVVVIPGDGACRQADNAAGESGAMTFQSKCRLGFDDESWRGTFPVDQHFLHPVLLRLEFSQG